MIARKAWTMRQVAARRAKQCVLRNTVLKKVVKVTVGFCFRQPERAQQPSLHRLILHMAALHCV
eukprot:7391369-Prymnesium_polylepis.2